MCICVCIYVYMYIYMTIPLNSVSGQASNERALASILKLLSSQSVTGSNCRV